MKCLRKNCSNPRKVGRTKRPYYVCDFHFRIESRKYYLEHTKQILANSKKVRKSFSAVKKQAIQFSARYKTKITEQDLESLLLKQLRKCGICKQTLTSGWHIDHIVPVALGGKSDYSNLQILCPMCNLGKYKFSQDNYIKHCQIVSEVYKIELLQEK